jgi:hypothetical protein
MRFGLFGRFLREKSPKPARPLHGGWIRSEKMNREPASRLRSTHGYEGQEDAMSANPLGQGEGRARDVDSIDGRFVS